MSDRRSIFLAHASTLPTSSALPNFISYLTSLPVLKRATHCMHAYRVIEIRPDLSRILHVGQHDGGEKGSGERLSRLLQALQCENVVVVVSRWYGGVKLGSDRWRMISKVAKDAIRRAAFVKEKTPDTPTSHGSRSKKRK
jgi:putative IMPACT (imprinted ancient) family translation regulator